MIEVVGNVEKRQSRDEDVTIYKYPNGKYEGETFRFELHLSEDYLQSVGDVGDATFIVGCLQEHIPGFGMICQFREGDNKRETREVTAFTYLALYDLADQIRNLAKMAEESWILHLGEGEAAEP